jgi:hypothetical protein
LKKTQELLMTSEAKVSATKTELETLRGQTTDWEVEISRLNAILPISFQNFQTFFFWLNRHADISFYFKIIPCFADIFPGSVGADDNAIILERAKRGVPTDSTIWDMADKLVALGARKANMTVYTEELLNGALSA